MKLGLAHGEGPSWYGVRRVPRGPLLGPGSAGAYAHACAVVEAVQVAVPRCPSWSASPVRPRRGARRRPGARARWPQPARRCSTPERARRKGGGTVEGNGQLSARAGPGAATASPAAGVRAASRKPSVRGRSDGDDEPNGHCDAHADGDCDDMTRRPPDQRQRRRGESGHADHYPGSRRRTSRSAHPIRRRRPSRRTRIRTSAPPPASRPPRPRPLTAPAPPGRPRRPRRPPRAPRRARGRRQRPRPRASPARRAVPRPPRRRHRTPARRHR